MLHIILDPVVRITQDFARTLGCEYHAGSSFYSVYSVGSSVSDFVLVRDNESVREGDRLSFVRTSDPKAAPVGDPSCGFLLRLL